MGRAELLANDLHKWKNSEIVLPSGQLFLMASAERDGDDGQMPRVIRSARDLVDPVSDAADATVLTPIFRLYKGGINNPRGRCVTEQDMHNLRRLIKEKIIRANDSVSEGTERVDKAFSVILTSLQNALSHGMTYQDMFWAFASDQQALKRFERSDLAKELCGLIDEEANNPEKLERYYWLALSRLLQEITPIFVSPVSSADELIAAVMVTGGLKSASPEAISTRGIPFLVISDTSERTPDFAMRPMMPTICHPLNSVDSCVRYLFQLSLLEAKTRSSPFEDAHR